MRPRLVSVSLLCTLLFAGLLSVPPVGAAPNEPGSTGAGSASSARPDPDTDRAVEVARAYLRAQHRRTGLSAADVADVAVANAYTDAHNGVTHVYFRQRYAGIEVHNAILNVAVARNGRVLSAGDRFVRDLAAKVNATAPGLDARGGVEAAAKALGIRLRQRLQVERSIGGPSRAVVFGPAGISLEPIQAKLLYVPHRDRVRLAWNVTIYQTDARHWWSASVDAKTGSLVQQDDYVTHAGEYNVFAIPKESPYDGGRTLEVDPADATASPFDWHDTDGAPGAEFTVTRGNNVHAYTDIDANNVPDAGSDPDGGPGLVFDFPLDLNQPPSTYRNAAVANLFYWNNIIHDVTYRYGFTETAGNFQVNNYGKGGVGNDDVRAEAQDGSGLNNANFGTPPDGSRPRMQMFVWTPPGGFSVTVNSGPIAGGYDARGAVFGPQLSDTGPVTGTVTLGNDGVGATADACEPLVGFPAGHIALVDRGTCLFVIKVKNAQNAGAGAVIVANNVPGNPITMGGSDPTITIPSVMISQADGTAFKANLPLDATLAFTGDPQPTRDSDLDAGVIAHEYGHGVSLRLTGGPATTSCLSNQEQMGEGWSDYLALVFTGKAGATGADPRGIGTYVNFDPPGGQGIRPTPYSSDLAINPPTYDTIKTAAVPHGVGYVWASMLWDVYWNLVEEYGFNPDLYGDVSAGGNNLALQLVMDGLKFQPCNPGFVDGRNAILTADQALTGGVNQCLIWRGFSRRGLGFSASQGSSSSRSDGVEAYDLPPGVCGPDIAVTPASLSSNLQLGDTETQGLSVGNEGLAGADDLSWTISEAAADCSTPGDLAWVSASPTAGATAAGASSAVDVTFDAGAVPIGVHTGLLCFASNDPDEPVVPVPVSLDADYAFEGFFGPIQNPPAMNEVQAGSAVPVIFSLNGDFGLGILAAGYPQSQPVDCATLAPVGAASATVTPGLSGLSYDPVADRYVYPWKSANGWAGTCRQLIVQLNDATNHEAFFSFKP